MNNGLDFSLVCRSVSKQIKRMPSKLWTLNRQGLRAALPLTIGIAFVTSIPHVQALKNQEASTNGPASKQPGDSKGTSKNSSRKIHFPSQYPVGVLRVVPRMRDVNVRTKIEMLAKGDVIVTVPDGQYLLLELAGTVITHPESIGQLADAPIDILLVKSMLSMKNIDSASSDKLTSDISKINNLRKVSFIHSDITDSGAVRLIALPHLTSVTFDLCESVKGTCLKQLAKCPNLTEVCLGECLNADKYSLRYLSQMPKLERLNLNHSAINENDAVWISKCRNLRRLDVRKNVTFDDKCLAHILSLKNLKELDIAGTSVTISGLKSLKSLHIKDLFVSDSLSRDVQQFQELKNELPDITITPIKTKTIDTKEISRWYEDPSYR
jgi:Leucine-rich repeat (LRR) protein